MDISLQENDTSLTFAFLPCARLLWGTPDWRKSMKIISVLLLTMLWFGCGYGSSKSAAAPQPGVVPVITDLSPPNAQSGGAGFTLTVNGSSFGSDATINWNGSKQGTTYVTGKQLTTAISAADIAAPGTVPVTVTDPGHAAGGIYGSGGTASATSSPMNFTIN
jgi:hypothetical protein